MPVTVFKRLVPLIALAALAACHHGAGWNLRKFQNSHALFEASLRELRRHKWDHAVEGFEKLTTDLPARDPLLPQAYYYLGQAHDGRHEYILAAQAYSRVPENFPEDTLADDATFASGRSYERLWRRPSLDADYGQTALSTFQSFLAAYPDSPLRAAAQHEIDHLYEWFATKDYQNGMLYFRRKAYESSEIYFKDVVQRYPQTREARNSMLRLAELYGKINYKEERQETCDSLRQKYPSDREVLQTCGPARATAQRPDSAKPLTP